MRFCIRSWGRVRLNPGVTGYKASCLGFVQLGRKDTPRYHLQLKDLLKLFGKMGYQMHDVGERFHHRRMIRRKKLKHIQEKLESG
jgi:hypothetical protein